MKYFIETWGCQMNDHDSEKLSGMLGLEGFVPAVSRDDAELVILNTCAVREKATQKVYSELGRLREIKLQRPLVIGVTGCVAQSEKEQIFKRAPYVDFVLGTMAIKQLPRLVEEARKRHGRVIDTREYPDNHLFPPEATRRRDTAKALVTIIEGCDHACTYCIVPTTRGPERHRPVEDILTEIRQLVRDGYREVELLGQNVNSFQGGCSFAALLDRVSEIDGLEWIRFTTSHPMNFTRELAETLVRNPKIAPFLHLPIQSGSDAVLRRMGRRYTVAEYLDRLGYLGEGRSRFCLSTDFIVGFPGETEEDFEGTMRVLETVKYDASFSFIYSPRPGTPATRMEDDVEMAVKSERLARLQARQTELTLASNRAMVGREMDARIESHEVNDHGLWMARTAQWRNVHLRAGEGAQLPFGETVRVRITEAGPHFLRAEMA